MIKIENTEVVGWEHAIRGMRNPMNSWDKIDSTFEHCWDREYSRVITLPTIGCNDMKLMRKLDEGGSVHAKYRRMIVVYADITAPLYWWKEFDTYKIGTVANSCSTMHKIGEKEFTTEDFSVEHLVPDGTRLMDTIIGALNSIREVYLDFDHFRDQGDLFPGITCKKDVWWQMIQLLPSSYNQLRTVMMSYEMLVNAYRWRKDHKLDEWRDFCGWIESLPYSELITGKE